jgi:hypothetical protein
MRNTLFFQKHGNILFHDINNVLSIIFGSFEPIGDANYKLVFTRKKFLPKINDPSKLIITTIITALKEYHITDIE